MSQQQLNELLDRVNAGMQNVVATIPAAPPPVLREGTYYKVELFYRNEDEDPDDQLEEFEKAAIINGQVNTRKLPITIAYLKGPAALQWNTARATVTQWGNNNAHFPAQFKAQFAIVAQKNRWYKELNNI